MAILESSGIPGWPQKCCDRISQKTDEEGKGFMLIKHFMSKLLLAIAMVIALCLPTPVIAALPTPQQVTVFHPSPEKSFMAGKDRFKFKHFTSGSGKNIETVALAEITLAPNYDGFLLQKHVVKTDEAIYAMDGDLQCSTASQPEQTVKLKVGDMLQIPAGIPYGCKALGSQPRSLLLVSSSSALENLITEIGTPSDRPAETVTEPDMTRVSAIAQKYGIEFLN
jgi:uncharacterized RmlC-like cupin family protein